MNNLFIDSSRFLIGTVSPWLATALLLLLGSIILSSSKILLRRAKKLKRLTLFGLLFCIFFGALIRFVFVPSGHRVYFDEDRYLSYAVNFARHGKAVSLILSTPDAVVYGDPDPAARITVPVINAWTLKIFGYNEKNLFIVAKLSSVFQIAVLFVAVLLLFEDETVALFCAIVFAFSPISVYWSVSTNIDVYFVTFSLLSVIACVMYAKRPSRKNNLFLWSCVTLLLMVRFESFLVLPSLFLTVWSVRRLNGLKLFSSKDYVIVSLLIPIILIRAIVSTSVFTSIWCCAEATPLEIFTTSYIMRNTIPNIETFVSRPEFPVAITILSLLTLLSIPFRKKTKDIRFLIFLSWMACFFFVYSFYYAGQFYSYTFSGSYGRFFLMEMVPVTIFAGLAWSKMLIVFRKSTFQERNWLLVGCGILIFTLIPTLMSYRRLITQSPWDKVVEVGPRTLHSYIDDVMIPKTQPDSAIIFGILAPIHLSGKTAIYTDNFMVDQVVMNFVENYLRSGKSVYYFETHTCDIYPEKCIQILKRFRFEDYPMATDPKYPGLELKQLRLRESV